MNNIILEPIWNSKTGLGLLYKWRNDKQIRPYLRTTIDNYLENQEEWFNSIIQRDDCFYYYIMSEVDLVGYCALEQIHWQNRTAEISLLINPNEYRKGIGKETVNQLLHIGFNRYNLNLIWGEVYEHNPAKEFWGKIGFNIEGILRERKYCDDTYFSSHMFSITRLEYYENL